MIYLDNNATTPVLPEVRDAMLPFLGAFFANPSSPYTPARKVAATLSRARESVGALIGAPPGRVIFTSGATESNATAIQAALELRPKRKHILSQATEHASVLECLRGWEKRGYEVSILPVQSDGSVDPDLLRTSIRDDTALVSLMAANNETGRIFPIEEFCEFAHERGALFHCDGVQAVGKLPVSVASRSVDFFSGSGHKLHGPKGIGFLYIRDGLSMKGLFRGGDQELGFRAGTENVPGIAGLGRAAELVSQTMEVWPAEASRMLDLFERRILRARPEQRAAVAAKERLPNTLMLIGGRVEAEAVIALMDMEDICISSGSACASGSHEPSHVLRAMGLSESDVLSALRISVGRTSRARELERAADILIEILDRLDRTCA